MGFGNKITKLAQTIPITGMKEAECQLYQDYNLSKQKIFGFPVEASGYTR
jgi:hypothetical protein